MAYLIGIILGVSVFSLVHTIHTKRKNKGIWA